MCTAAASADDNTADSFEVLAVVADLVPNPLAPIANPEACAGPGCLPLKDIEQRYDLNARTIFERHQSHLSTFAGQHKAFTRARAHARRDMHWHHAFGMRQQLLDVLRDQLLIVEHSRHHCGILIRRRALSAEFRGRYSATIAAGYCTSVGATSCEREEVARIAVYARCTTRARERCRG